MNLRDLIDAGCIGDNCGRPNKGPGKSHDRPAATAFSHGYRLHADGGRPNGPGRMKVLKHDSGCTVEVSPNIRGGKLYSWKHKDPTGVIKKTGVGGRTLHDHLAVYHGFESQYDDKDVKEYDDI